MIVGLSLWRLLALIVVGAVAGGSSGLLGIGGGVIMVPALVVLFSLTQHAAQGTALAVMIPTAMVGAYSYAGEGKVNLPVAAALTVGAVVAARCGAGLASVLPREALRTLFALLMVIAAVRMMPRGTTGEMGVLAGVLAVAVVVRMFLLR
ncbi:MAG TPA: sulfite exporter TauE/SafE family protein [Armatimonadota bacterium]|nr:sulfite exporter TauE/SafE family protein [Armatimonadota bacterium]